MKSPYWIRVPASNYAPIQTQERALRELDLPTRERSICLVKRDEDWFAIAPTCPHQGGPLAAGLRISLPQAPPSLSLPPARSDLWR